VLRFVPSDEPEKWGRRGRHPYHRFDYARCEFAKPQKDFTDLVFLNFGHYQKSYALAARGNFF
jgi:hypothetical protein